MSEASESPKVMKAIYGDPNRPLKVGNIEIPCYVLEDGTRVLSGRGVQGSLGLGQGHGSQMRNFMAMRVLEPFIGAELAMALDNPIRFIRPNRGGVTAAGYDARILPEICKAIIKAKQAGALTTVRQLHVAHQAEILVMGFATVGIIALIDEATGYQEFRARNELNQILEKYIAKELLPWSRRFPNEFYENLFRLRGWDYDPLSVKRPQYVGKLTDYIVYRRLPPGVLDELRNKNPKNENGHRRYKHHQFLTPEVGHFHLDRHLIAVITLMRVAKTWEQFDAHLRMMFPVPDEQLKLDLADEGDDAA